ncbi:carbohydrate ABC transporter permease [Serinibacter salmoneus]|uniref:Carbohydrate ABC transporter membrane protein 2 (CUT1 family) n=1 Tax=Serinibacter salmoneus TaxID=556530 RepID=A0A2A9D254_9MICO|nr:carbohydrate ABC transporter permease [Serinibacter salmoneus]PFG20798.1 carbohydrate ABC transporter membrane protein 2 (CUT1 family) [Serinibacter salmoneus]
MSSYQLQTRAISVGKWVVIALLVIAAVFPFYYMIVMSFVRIEDLLRNPLQLFPDLATITTETYRRVLAPEDEGGFGFSRFMRNSAIVATGATVLTMLLAIPASYAMTRLRFAGRRQVSALFLAVYMFPTIIIAVPIFVGFQVIGLGSSLPGLTIAYIALTVPVCVHMLRSYMQSIPEAIDEAAYMDGANRWQIMTRITVPLTMPTLMSTALFAFMIAWNEFLFALLFLTAKKDLWTVSLGLNLLSDGQEVPKTILMAGSVLLTVPIVALYAIAERYLTEGLTAGASKG